MNIKDALKETGRVKKGKTNECSSWQAGFSWYAERQGYDLVWVNKVGKVECKVSYLDIIKDSWIPYHPVEQIVPKNAGELWKYNGVEYMTMVKSVHVEEKLFMKSKYDCFCAIEGSIEVIHNQNGWTRIHPPVKEAP